MSDPTAQNPQTRDPLTQQTTSLPQDADTTQTVPAASTGHLPERAPSAAWTTWVPRPEHQPSAGDPGTPNHPSGAADPATEAAAAATPAAPSYPATPDAPSYPATPDAPSYQAYQPPPRHQRQPVTYLPAPTGPNWGLVVVGLVFGLVGAGVVANQVTGFQVSSLTELGPSVLVIAGLACALLGLAGIVTRRRRG
jgi:LPXTG-motif cell wall-anchored protein